MTTNGTAAGSTPALEPLATNVEYTIGLMGRAQPGMLVFDGVDKIVLVANDGTEIFSKTTAQLGKVRRVEYALYFKVDGKTITIVFGNALKYVAASGGLMQAGVAGVVLSDLYAKGHTSASGMDQWEATLKATGNSGLNASARNTTKYFFYYPLIGLGVIFAVVLVIGLLAG